MTPLALLFALLAVPAGDAPAEKGTFCLLQKNDQHCMATAGMTLAVVPEETPRAFVWASADGSRLVLGTVAAKTSTISVDERSRSAVALSIGGDRRRGWPLQTRMTLASKEREWTFPLSAKTVTKLRRVSVPPGTYRLIIAAEHHLTARRALNAADNVVLGEIILRPLPAIVGRVVNVKGEPLAGAEIVRPDGAVQATTNEQGQFRTELAEPIPDEILVRQGQLASALIPLERTGGDTDLGSIQLGAGVKLTLRFVRPSLESVPLRVRLLRESGTKDQPSPIAARELPEKEEQVFFSGLAAGNYVVAVEGKDPLQRLSKRFAIKDSDATEEIRIAPFRLEGSVRVGDDPLHGGSIDVRDVFHSWQATVAIDDLGRFGGSMWQNGIVAGFVDGPAVHELVDSPDLGADPTGWEILFKRRYLRGRVFDEDTGQPVDQPTLRLHITSIDGESNLSLAVQPDGSYSTLAVRAGTYELRADAPGHVPAQTSVSVAAEDAADRQVDLPLARGVQQVVEFTWPSGQAVAGAPVLEGIAGDGFNPERTYGTDGAGRLTLTLRRGESKTIYIVPREGSFAVAHVVASERSDADPFRVVVPAPTAGLRVEMRDAADKPLAAMLLFRFNGELIPQPVILRLTGQYENAQSLRVPNLPAGAYELWGVPVTDYAFAPLAGRAPGRAPMRVGLTMGEQSVKVIAAPLE